MVPPSQGQVLPVCCLESDQYVFNRMRCKCDVRLTASAARASAHASRCALLAAALCSLTRATAASSPPRRYAASTAAAAAWRAKRAAARA